MSENTKKANHITWADYAKGLAIFGVVLWHVVGGVVNSGIPTTEAMARFGWLWDFYTFRLMPIFFFISGAFFVRSLERPFWNVLDNKLRTVAYPYAIWTIITLIIGTLTASVRNGTETIADLPRLFYDPISHYWFLYALFVIMIAYYVLHKVRINRWLIVIGSVILFIAVTATVLYDRWYIAGQIGYFAIYFVAGAWVGPAFMQAVQDTSLSKHVGILIASIIALILIPINDINTQGLIWQPLASTVSMILTISLAAILSRVKGFGFVRYWGQLSLEIYLVHVLAFSSFRIVMYNILGIDHAWFHIIAGIIVGLYVPIVVTWVANRIGFPFLFRAPQFKRSAELPQAQQAS